MTYYEVKLGGPKRRPFLVMEKEFEYGTVGKIDEPRLVADMMTKVFGIGDLAEESVFLIALNPRHDVTGVFMVGRGGVSQCQAGMREIFMRALLVGAAQIVLVHNHPSGNPEPSEQDIFVTRTAAKAGSLLGVMLTDHVIVGNGSYFSMRETYPSVLEETF